MADLVVAIAAALLLRSVWALAFGLLAGNFVRFVMSYFYSYRPRVRLEIGRAKELYSFGRWVLGSSVLVFLLTQGDDALVGKILGAIALGFYQMGYRLSQTPATEITHVISQITFPTYSQLQDNLSKLREAYLRTLQLTAFISIPLAGGIFILAPEFTKIFLGDKWMPMIPAMQALAIGGAIRSIGATFGPLLQAIGKPEILAKFMFIQLILVGILIYPFTLHWNILGTALACIIPGLIVNAFLSYEVVKVIKCRIGKFCKKLGYPLANTGLMLLFILILLKTNSLDSVGTLKFFLFVLIGTLVFLSGVYVSDRVLDYGMIALLKETGKEIITKGES